MDQQRGPFAGVIAPPLAGREGKPRRVGLTVVMEKGLGPAGLRDLLTVAASYIDFWKFGFGTAALHSRVRLQEKIALLGEAGICPYPGGTLLEAAEAQGEAAAFLRQVRRLGFEAVEVSEGTISLTPERRRRLISAARDLGLRVLAEVGKKDPAAQPTPGHLAEQALADLDAGAEYVIIEGRESGQGVGIYDSAGRVREEVLAILTGALPLDRIIWEAPQKRNQQALILRFGPNVSLGNVPPTEVVALEALRCGLRGDTLAVVVGAPFGTASVQQPPQPWTVDQQPVQPGAAPAVSSRTAGAEVGDPAPGPLPAVAGGEGEGNGSGATGTSQQP